MKAKGRKVARNQISRRRSSPGRFPAAHAAADEDEDPGQRDVEQPEDDAGREVEELARLEFGAQHPFGGIRVERADDEKPGEGKRRGQQDVTGDRQKLLAQPRQAQAAAGQQRETAAAADERDDRPLGQESGGQQHACCGQPPFLAGIQPHQQAPESGR